MDYFLKDAKENFASAVSVNPRIWEIGLLVPTIFAAVAKEFTVATIQLKF